MGSQRLLVLSDTHGSILELTAILNWAQDDSQSKGIDAAVFLGDGIADMARASNAVGFSCECKIVRGNNDFGVSAPEIDIFDFGGYRFFLCHGHNYSIYSGHHTLIAAACNVKANVALFGHTHTPFHYDTDNVLLVNPGSIGRPRTKTGASFAVIKCNQGKSIKTEFWGIDQHGKIHKIKRISHE